MPIKIFFCYAHEDEVLLNKLKAHLKPLQRQGLIDIWHDRDISAGAEWEAEIKKQLETADILLLLISPDFMDFEYCYTKEMKRALERHDRGEACVIPVILRHVYWHGEPLGKLQALPTDGKPVTDREWQDLDKAFFNVVTGICKVIEELNLKPSIPLPSLPPKQETVSSVQKRNLHMIDLSIEAAREIGADQHPVSLADLHNAYLRANPGIGKGTTPESFGAMINWYTINMRARFPDPRNKQKPASWSSRPVFKRVARARYMLLSPGEIALFRQRFQEGDPRIYDNEYDIDDLN